MAKMEPHVTEIKRNEVENIKDLMREYKIMGIVNLENLPASNYMKIKYGIKDKVKLKYTKKRLMKIAFDESGSEKLKHLKERLIGIPALIFTNEEPFKLSNILKKSKTNAPAKIGDTAPLDIVIPAGPTDFTPGPMIGELGAMGIKTKVENGKLTILFDKLLVKIGEKINEKNAALMTKLNIQPMKIGLNLVLTYENGEVMEGSVLDINIEDYENDIKMAVGDSMALAIYIAYLTKETIRLLIGKASLEANSLKSMSKFEEKIGEAVTAVKSEQESEKKEEKYVINEEGKSIDSFKGELKTVVNENLKTVEDEVNFKEIVEDTSHIVGEEIEKEIKCESENELSVMKDDITKVVGISDVDQEDIKKAQDILRQLQTKKMKGEI